MRQLMLRSMAMATAATVSLGASSPAGEYVEKSFHDHVARLPTVSGFAAVCEENSTFAEKARRLTPVDNEFLTCSSDAAKWQALVAGKGSDLYPMIFVTVQRPHAGGLLSPAEFEQLRAAAREKLSERLFADGNPPKSVQKIDEFASGQGPSRKTDAYEQRMQGFFDAPSKAPSFSFLTSRNSTITEAGQTYNSREVTAISTVYYFGDVLQVMVVDQGKRTLDLSRVREVTKQWLDAFNELNPTSK